MESGINSFDAQPSKLKPLSDIGRSLVRFSGGSYFFNLILG